MHDLNDDDGLMLLWPWILCILFVCAIVRARLCRRIILDAIWEETQTKPHIAVRMVERRIFFYCVLEFLSQLKREKKISNTPLLIYGQPIENFSFAWSVDTKKESKKLYEYNQHYENELQSDIDCRIHIRHKMNGLDSEDRTEWEQWEEEKKLRNENDTQRNNTNRS